MCGRFNVETAPLTRWLLEVLGVGHPGPDNHNAAPTELIPVLRADVSGSYAVTPLRWWLTPHWAKEQTTRYSMFNARRETLATSPAFREPFRRHRCVVPISGFYEWAVNAPGHSPGGVAGNATGNATGNAMGSAVGDAAAKAKGKPPGKVPWYIRPHAEPGLLLAGIWDRWSDPAGAQTLESFAVVTTGAHPALRFVHSRQPVMLGLDAARRWLDPAAEPAELEELLEPELPVALDAVPVSSHVNNARHKDRRCIEPVAAAVPVATSEEDIL